MQLSVQVDSQVSKCLLGFFLCHVSVHLPVVHRLKDVVVSRAVVMACAGLDKHHSLLHDLTVGTLEFHREGGCSVGGAATPVGADATELGSIGLHTSAAGQLKLDWLGDLGSSDTLLAFLLGAENGIHIITRQIYKASIHTVQYLTLFCFYLLLA